jgi:hypothetical protein
MSKTLYYTLEYWTMGKVQKAINSLHQFTMNSSDPYVRDRCIRSAVFMT